MKDTVIEFLRGHNTMSLATSRNNDPCAAALFYASDGLTLYFISDTSSEHSHNISLNPRVAATINADYSDWKDIRGLRITGRACMVREEEAGTARDVFESKYPFLTGLLESGELRRGLGGFAFFKINPETIRLIDNRVYFGYRAEIQV
ncbi:MAG: pyridoxamine 5'-phosphate oxidase family protein [Candidatus Dadabacteria bacterium]|nr:pyridoxamine 5'-phosphate oxidase family protein [Candidatus Dadabacteria bacterium]